jgi:ferredoxin
VPADQQQFIEINERLAKVWPVISARKEALEDADTMNGIPDKLELLIEE